MTILDDLKMKFRTGNVVTQLLFWNVALFVVPLVIFSFLKLFRIDIDFLHFISLSSDPKALFVRPWTLISYAFFHNDFFHVLFNMLLLNFAGQLFVTFFTQKQVLGLYLASAIFSGFVYIFSYLVFPALSNQTVYLVGASGAIMAILVATATYQPMMEVRLFLLGNIKLVYLVLALLVIDLIQLPMNNTGGHLAHIGGSIFGYLFVTQIRNGIDITAWATNIISFFSNLFQPKKKYPFKKVYVNPKKPIEKRDSKIIFKDENQKKIDSILDKIGQSGYDSLTQTEKQFLISMNKNN